MSPYTIPTAPSALPRGSPWSAFIGAQLTSNMNRIWASVRPSYVAAGWITHAQCGSDDLHHANVADRRSSNKTGASCRRTGRHRQNNSCAHLHRRSFDDGLGGDVDLFIVPREGPIFAPLAKLPSLKQFTLEGGTLAWPNGADIGPERLYEMTESAGDAVERTRWCMPLSAVAVRSCSRRLRACSVILTVAAAYLRGSYFAARNLSREPLATAGRFSSSFALGSDPTKRLGVQQPLPSPINEKRVAEEYVTRR